MGKTASLYWISPWIMHYLMFWIHSTIGVWIFLWQVCCEWICAKYLCFQDYHQYIIFIAIHDICLCGYFLSFMFLCPVQPQKQIGHQGDWVLWSSVGTLKLAFNVLSDNLSSQPDVSVSVACITMALSDCGQVMPYCDIELRSSSVQVMGSCLLGARPFSEPVPTYSQLNPWDQNSVRFNQNQNIQIFLQENAFENVRKNIAISPWPLLMNSWKFMGVYSALCLLMPWC